MFLILFITILIGLSIGVINVLKTPGTSTSGSSTSYLSINQSAVSVHVVVLVDNNPYRPGLETAWGLSIYVELGDVSFLFDTGPDPGVLEANAVKLGVDLSRLNFVVISHIHGDHTGGLKLVASIKPGLEVYIPPDPDLSGYIRSIGLQPVIVNDTMEVSSGVYIIKPLYGPPFEDAVAINTSKGLLILAGCSHPGVINIVRQALNDLGVKPYIVIGGFHMSGASISEVEEVISRLLELGVEKIYPIHCSGGEVRDYLAHHYRDVYGDGGVGLEIAIK
jgi:7,8-dihydropterin-6-yl-methyl-4-(beta-D-ribofuranosyl)aminobenzene 5'-phosphate synthase